LAAPRFPDQGPALARLDRERDVPHGWLLTSIRAVARLEPGHLEQRHAAALAELRPGTTGSGLRERELLPAAAANDVVSRRDLQARHRALALRLRVLAARRESTAGRPLSHSH